MLIKGEPWGVWGLGGETHDQGSLIHALDQTVEARNLEH